MAHFQYLCNECLLLRTHEAPSHNKVSFSQLALSDVPCDKIVSSAVSEISHIERSLEVARVRKSDLVQSVNNLKKEVGNNVVQICQAVMQRGNDLIYALDSVQHMKITEYDRLRKELDWQQMRFERISAFVTQVKNFEDETARVLAKVFLENCARVVKYKKTINERSLNGLQRPSQVLFKPDTQSVMDAIGRWGRVLADTNENNGSLKPVEVVAAPATSNPIDVPLFNLNQQILRFPTVNMALTSIPVDYQQFRPQMIPYASSKSTMQISGNTRLIQEQQHLQNLHQKAHLQQMGYRQQLQRMQQLQKQQPMPKIAQELPAHTLVPRPPTILNIQQPATFPAQLQQIPFSVFSPVQSVPQHISASTSYSDPRLPTYNPVSPVSPHQLFPVTSAVLSTGRIGYQASPVQHQMVPLLSGKDSLNGIQKFEQGSYIPANPITSAILTEASYSKGYANNYQQTNLQIADDISRTSENANLLRQQVDKGKELSAEISVISLTKAVRQATSDYDASSGGANCTPPPKDPMPASVEISSNCTPFSSSEITDPKRSIQDKIAEYDDGKWDDYCYVCQQGCDETTGSLGCCAKCPRVFHNSCHIPAIKEKMESLPDDWACSLCLYAEPMTEQKEKMGPNERLVKIFYLHYLQPKKLCWQAIKVPKRTVGAAEENKGLVSRRVPEACLKENPAFNKLDKLCSKVLLRCYEKFSFVEPFIAPVPKSMANYYSIIKKPMDFGTISRKLKERAKDAFTNVLQFLHHMNLVFMNCSTFNHPESEIARAGYTIYLLYKQAVNEFLPFLSGYVWSYDNLYDASSNIQVLYCLDIYWKSNWELSA
ncbi:unnamed protein product [Dracunculus medinensis]|uniref:Bromo domain-containing protein n=1 Tax=Dracunculus medinensis TaxID=318479 RepID=A0A0N4U9R6_DRAME|nr:unnamed protein product [Dracunculus medinensis]